MRKTTLVALGLCVFTSGLAWSQGFTSQRVIPLGYCQLSAAVLANSTSFTACPINPLGIPAGATCVLLGVETAAINYRDDGTVPTTTTGLQLPFGVAPFSYCGNLANLKFIAAAAGSPKLDILFYRLGG